MDTFILSNVEQLSEITDVNEQFLTILVNKKLITSGTKEEILAKHGDYVRASLFYSKICKTSLEDDYPEILEALEKSLNRKALDYFETKYRRRDLGMGAGGAGVEGACFSSRSRSEEGQGSGAVSKVTNTAQNEEYVGIIKLKALIINVLKNRPGAEKDTRPLKRALAGCGFKVDICSNLTKKGILSAVARFKRHLKVDDDCILIAVMSHGFNSTQFATDDDQSLDVNDSIVAEFNENQCPILKGKPKIFLFNFCRGIRLLHEDFTQLQLDSGGVYSDIIKCFSTYDKHVSNRQSYGTWFMQAFCKTIQENSDGATSFTVVMDKVHYAVAAEGRGKSKQCSTYENTGFKNLYLESLPGITCHYYMCKEAVKLEDYDEHLNTAHCVEARILDNNVFTNDWSYDSTWATAIPPLPLDAFGETFILNFTTPHGQWEPCLYLWLTVLGTDATARKFMFEFNVLPLPGSKSKGISNGPLPVLAFPDGEMKGISQRKGVKKIDKESLKKYCRSVQGQTVPLFKAQVEILKVH